MAIRKIISTAVLTVILAVSIGCVGVSASGEVYTNGFDDENTFSDNYWTVGNNGVISREINITYDNTPASMKVSVKGGFQDGVYFSGIEAGANVPYYISLKIKTDQAVSDISLMANSATGTGSPAALCTVTPVTGEWNNIAATYQSDSGVPISCLYLKIGDGRSDAVYYIDEFKISTSSNDVSVKNPTFKSYTGDGNTNRAIADDWKFTSSLPNLSIGGNISDYRTTIELGDYSNSNLAYSQTKPNDAGVTDNRYIMMFNAMKKASENVYPVDGVKVTMYQNVDLRKGTYYDLSVWLKLALFYSDNKDTVYINIKDQAGNLINSECGIVTPYITTSAWTHFQKTIYIDRDVDNAVVELRFAPPIPKGTDNQSLAGKRLADYASGDINYRLAVDDFYFQPNKVLTEAAITAGNLMLNGKAVPSRIVHGSFECLGVLTEKNCEYRLFRGSDPNSENGWEVIQSGLTRSSNGIDYLVTQKDAGKYLKLAVRPIALNGIKGNFSAIFTNTPVKQQFYVTANGAIRVAGGQVAKVPIVVENNGISEGEVMVTAVFYKTGNMVGILADARYNIMPDTSENLSLEGLIPADAERGYIYAWDNIRNMNILMETPIEINISSN